MKLESFSFGIKLQLITLIVLSIAIYSNTLFHEYALDDIVVMTENRLVAKGINGIPEILSTDYVYGYSTKENILTGARYRPLSLIFFALEYQFFGANPLVSHSINILAFALLIALMYKLLQTYVFQKQHDYLAFVTCLLFAVHPIHTEIISNVKGRDELITFLLLISSLISTIKYISKSQWWLFLSSLICFFLALFTKETAVTFIGIVPLILYFFFNQTLKKSILFSIPFVLVFIVYLGLRYLIVGFNTYPVNDVTNTPYLYASMSEAFATKVFILFKYLWLLVFPHPLTSDYGYNQIPYLEMSSIRFILSLILILSLIVYAIRTFKKRSVFSFCILYFFATISVGTNLIIDLGTTMAERMLFQPSLAFCIALAIVFLRVRKNSKVLSTIFLSVLVFLFSFKTLARNKEWENNETLFLADVISSPNSSRLNLYVCERYIIKGINEPNNELRTTYLNKAVYYGERSLQIHSKFAYTYVRLGLAYFYQFNYFKAANSWIQALQLDPGDSETRKWAEQLSDILYKQGNGFYELGKTDDAIENYRKSIELNNGNIESWYNLGGNYYLKDDTLQAMKAWKKVKILNPNHVLKKDDF